MPHAPRTAALALAALLVLAGCGGSDEGGGTASPDTGSGPAATSDPATSDPAAPTGDGGTESSAPADGEGQTLAVTAVDFEFQLPTTEFSAGDLTIDLTNDGNASHNLVVERDGEDVAETETISPGDTSSVTVTLEPGDYVFYCSIANHRAMGMEVTVTVT